jgi:hypothetical protein
MKRDSTRMSPPQNLCLRKHLKKLSGSDKYSKKLLRCSCGGSIVRKKMSVVFMRKNEIVFLLRISEEIVDATPCSLLEIHPTFRRIVQLQYSRSKSK